MLSTVACDWINDWNFWKHLLNEVFIPVSCAFKTSKKSSWDCYCIDRMNGLCDQFSNGVITFFIIWSKICKELGKHNLINYPPCFQKKLVGPLELCARFNSCNWHHSRISLKQLDSSWGDGYGTIQFSLPPSNFRDCKILHTLASPLTITSRYLICYWIQHI